MAVQMSEYRERLLAQGCDEGLADAVLALVVEARDDAVAEALTRAEARSEHSEQVLGERLNGHVEKNEGQFESLMSTIHGSANQLRATFERRFTELSGKVEELRGELKAQKAENEARHAQLKMVIYQVGFGVVAAILTVAGVLTGLAAAGVFG